MVAQLRIAILASLKTPHDEQRVPGGSSGGSAAAVAMNLTPFALGSDTGGSIRQPASFTGTFGLKPTYGTTSRYGVVAMASSTDVMGPITSNAEDVAVIMNIIAKQDVNDSTTIQAKDFKLEESIDYSTLKVGYIKQHFEKGVDDDVKATAMDLVNGLKARGASVSEVDLPTISYALAAYYIIVPAEISSNLGRYDGIKFGYQNNEAEDLDSSYRMSRSKGFNEENKRRIMIGTYVLSSGYYDAYYKKAQQVRTKIIDEFSAAFADYDVLIGPTAPTPAFKIGENTADPVKMYLADVMTVGMSLAGIPALSVPWANNSEGLPIGVQLCAAQNHDNMLVAIAHDLTKERSA